MNTDTIRALVRAHPRTTEGYPPHVREAVGSYAQRRRDEGARWTDIEDEVGVSSTSMSHWMRTRSRGFQHVELVDDEPQTELEDDAFVITSPSGFTLTGCTLEQAVAVLARLG